MLKIEQLQSAKTLHDVAHLLGYKPSRLSYLLYILSDDKKYRKFEIPKKSGGVRNITAPCEELKTLQHRLSQFLQDCIDNINHSRKVKDSISHGFKRKRSIITNAKKHRNKRYVLNLDIRDFFGSINFGRVRGFFIKNRNFELEPKVATILAQIACHDNALPQGSPLSPVVSNLISHTLDIHLVSLATRHGCRYSRYADDLTFSTNKKVFPSQIARSTGVDHVWELGDRLEKEIKRAGFEVNRRKTRVQYTDSRQEVTGLVVNRKVNVRAEYWRTARAMANSLFKTGSFNIKKPKILGDGTRVEEQVGSVHQLAGMLSFIDMVDKYNKRNIHNKHERRHLNSRERVLKAFVFYKNFYNTSKPVIMCEGKTDYVYLQSALSSLHKKYPSLIKKHKDGQVNYEINMFRYNEISDRLFSLSGGADTLAQFIGNYTRQCAGYETPISSQPIIIVTDNDSGVKSVFAAAKKKHSLKDDVKGDKPFYYIGDNLYLVPIPKIGASDTAIEEYFEHALLKTKIDGKTFNYRDKKIDHKNEYSKAVFAERIVKINKGAIDFKNFSAIIDNINLAISDYKKIVAAAAK